MTKSFRLAAHSLAASALILVPLSATGQGVYGDQVATYLDEMEGRLIDASANLEGEATGWMMAGSDGATIVRLPAGQYVAFGACDDDCSDIDLVVTLMDSQQTLDVDQELDSFPIVEFTLSAEADVLIGLSMPDCATARCYAGYRWFSNGRGAAAGGAGAAAGTWEEQVAAQMESMSVDALGIEDERTGLVAAGQEERFSVNLAAGSYQARAVCDYDCSDVDLAVFDGGGTLVDSDVLVDDIPIVNFQVGKGGGTYYFAVQMVDCTTGSCGYGFRLFRTR